MTNSKINHIELRSEEVQEILEAVPSWMIRWGNVLFLSLILMLLFISWFVRYPDIINAEALITTEIPPQKEYAKITAKLDTLLVEDNQLVRKNQPLAILENTANYNDVFTLLAVMDTIKINNKYFSFPIKDLPILFLGDIESSYASFENNYIKYTLNKQLKPFINEAIANQFSISELNGRLQGLKAQKMLNLSELQLKEKDIIRSRELFEQGTMSAYDFEKKQLEYLQAESNYKRFDAQISQIREELSNAQKSSRGTEINKTREEVILLKNVIQSFNQLKKNIKDWESTYVLKSEINGSVSFLSFWSSNQTVNNGDLVFTIIPSQNSSFIAKLKTPARNSGKLNVMQTVNLKLENYPEAEFGTLEGKISKISLFPDSDGYYFVDVTLPKELITSYKRPITFKQEMRGSAEIITDDLRLIERFFFQLKNVFRN